MAYSLHYCTNLACVKESFSSWKETQKNLVDKYGKAEYTGLYVERDGIVIWEEKDV